MNIPTQRFFNRLVRMPKLKDTIACIGSAMLLTAIMPVCAEDRTALINEAYNYAFPLYKLSEYRWTALETSSSTSTTLNHFAHSRAIATPDDRWAAAPIVDALYSTSWINLADGPAVIDTPDTNGRYYVLTLIDFYSNTFFYAGHRTTGTNAQKYFLVGPDWHGQAPTGATLVRSSTNDVYLNLRVLIDGPADQHAANAVQDGFLITPAGHRETKQQARIKPVPNNVENFLGIVNQMLALNAPPARDQALIERYRAVGICGAECNWNRLPDAVKAEWHANYPKLEHQFLAGYLAAGAAARGWIDYNPPGSKLGSTEMRDYNLRAAALALGMGILGVTRTEADYWITLRDGQGRQLVGNRRYRLHLPPGGIPANAFWSVALYTVEKDGQYLSRNPLNRYHISSRTPNLATNADGSIDIWIQAEPPEDKKANWLPAPADGQPFELFARAYEPGPSVLNGEFNMPPVEQLP